MTDGSEPIKAVRVRIEGRVQGVWYRGWAVQEATRRGLHGWVRNRSDGSVEALFCGPVGTVEGMLDACRQGPPAARVDRLTYRLTNPPEQTGFRPMATL